MNTITILIMLILKINLAVPIDLTTGLERENGGRVYSFSVIKCSLPIASLSTKSKCL